MRRTSRKFKKVKRKPRKKPKKPKKKFMQAFILTREAINAPGGHVTIGVYTSLVLAEAARDTKIAAFVAARNALRDTAYGAGDSFNQVLTVADVLPLAYITEVTIGA